jgi:hypothetical protein
MLLSVDKFITRTYLFIRRIFMKQNKHFTTIFFALIFSIVFFTSGKAQYIDCSIQDCIDYTGPYTGTVNSIIITSSVTDLTRLSGITSVTGNLIIQSTTGLTNLNGLNNITSVGGNIEIYGNNALTNLAGLENLTSVGGYIYIATNNALTSLRDWKALPHLISLSFSKVRL